jgi:hypothetical protein
MSLKRQTKPPETLVISHANAGFFSCCSMQLHEIVRFFNKYKELPSRIDTSQQFDWYKPTDRESESITADYFSEDDVLIKYRGRVDYEHWYQYLDYKKLNYTRLNPFIKRYFTPSNDIKTFVEILEAKYSIDYKNLCVLFYRGNDKITETPSAPYQDYVDRARLIQAENSDVRFLIQSDETEFIDRMSTEFLYPAFFFRDEIRHINKSINTVDKVWSKDDNYKFSQLYLAITIIMSKAKYVICGTGNCSMWICFYRGSADNVQQFLKTAWV